MIGVFCMRWFCLFCTMFIVFQFSYSEDLIIPKGKHERVRFDINEGIFVGENSEIRDAVKNIIKLQEQINLVFDLLLECKTNPFKIDFQEQKEISSEEYLYIQETLRKIDILPLLKKLYPKGGEYLSLEDFQNRCSVGIRRELINIQKDQFPIARLEKVGEGGEYCIVTSAPYDNNRNILLKGLVKQLHKTGFNGYIYYQIGGYPNPTEKEIRYVGVPYAFKIFMMMEAEKLGFNKILWLDSALWPIYDPLLFFQHIEESGAVFHSVPNSNMKKYIFPKTRQLLKILTGKDPCKSPYVWGAVFGMDFRKEECKQFFKEYLNLVKLGRPFLSCFPEEFVFTCLLDKPEFEKCKQDFGKHINFVCYEGHCLDIEEVIDNGFYFYHKIH